MSKLFSIGEMAKIHQVPIKTLRYYDEIGLLKPAEVNPDSGYRYYSHHQFEALNTIMFMKYLGIPLKEIKKYLAYHDKKDYMNLLMKEKSIIMGKMAVLGQMLTSIDRQLAEVKTTMTLDTYDQVSIKKLEERRAFVGKAEIRNTYDLELALHELKRKVYKDVPIVVGQVGLTISKERILSGHYDGFDGVFILTENPGDTEVLPGGLHACINYRGEDHSDSPKYYRQLMGYLDAHDYEVVGNAVERVIINSYKSSDKEDYLTEIQIPIRSTNQT